MKEPTKIIKYRIPDFSQMSDNELERYFDSMKEKLDVLEKSPTTFDMLRKVTGAFVIMLNITKEYKERGYFDTEKFDFEAKIEHLLKNNNINKNAN